jgi:hypothetical protein
MPKGPLRIWAGVLPTIAAASAISWFTVGSLAINESQTLAGMPVFVLQTVVLKSLLKALEAAPPPPAQAAGAPYSPAQQPRVISKGLMIPFASNRRN